MHKVNFSFVEAAGAKTQMSYVDQIQICNFYCLTEETFVLQW